MLTLTPRATFSVSLDVRGLLPEICRELTLSQIEKLPLLLGNSLTPLAELFRIQGNTDTEMLEFIATGEAQSLDRVDWLGANMRSGSIRVEGNLGNYGGAEMSGGTLSIAGSIGSSAGCQMSGGTLLIRDEAGDNLAGVFPGSLRGQRGGMVFVGGSAGDSAGQFQRRGALLICQSSGAEIGFGQRAGTILIGGRPGSRCGHGMIRGSIIVLSTPSGNSRATSARPDNAAKFILTPGRFVHGYRGQPAVLGLISRWISSRLGDNSTQTPPAIYASGKALAEQLHDNFDLFHGDCLEQGRGEIWLRCN